jgi:hypothetical protein|tara:strand:- start:4941 stop:5093 length:153 start_codon:yes stop_codon:yes gene_type:complete
MEDITKRLKALVFVNESQPDSLTIKTSVRGFELEDEDGIIIHNIYQKSND